MQLLLQIFQVLVAQLMRKKWDGENSECKVENGVGVVVVDDDDVVVVVVLVLVVVVVVAPALVFGVRSDEVPNKLEEN